MSSNCPSAMLRGCFLREALHLRRDEVWPVIIATGAFFLVLSGLMALRPARDALGMETGFDVLRWLAVCTALVTLAVTPLFGWLVSRLGRLQVISATYCGVVLSLIGFWVLLVFAPEPVREVSGQAFYVWYSVINLFATAMFWAFLNDYFSPDQARRCFTLISVGGTLGAIFGPWLASRLAGVFETPNLLLVTGGFLMLAPPAVRLLVHVAPDRSADMPAPPAGFAGEAERVGGSAWAAIGALLRTPYLAGIAAYVLLLAIMATFIYFTRLQMVAALTDDVDVRTAVLGDIDMWTQITVLALQLTLTGPIIRRFGLGVALAILPAVTAIGFIGLAIYGSILVLVLLEAASSAVQRGITRPAREALYTVVDREDKYKAKAFIDTFIYSGGSGTGAHAEGLVGRLGMGMLALTGAILPLALLWAALGIWLGRTHAQRIPRRYGALDVRLRADQPVG